MRDSPWRSHARLLHAAPALLALGACAPQFDLNNSPPPCLPNYALCPVTGKCQPVDPSASSDKALPLNCPAALELRQGDHVFLSAPGAGIDDLTVDGVPDDMLTAKPDMDQGNTVIRIDAPHGTPAGDAFKGKTRIITITTKLGNDQFVRSVPVIVSYITAAPGGDDTGPGTFGHPYAKLKQAVLVAGANDTIILRNPPNSTQMSVPGPGDDATTPLTLPDGITLKCVDNDPASLKMEIDLAGDATLESLSFDGPRLVINKPPSLHAGTAAGATQARGSKVFFVNDILSHGLTVDQMASAAPGQQGTEVTISGSTQVFDDRPPNAPVQSPLFLDANGATIVIDNSGVKMTDETVHPMAPDAILLSGIGDTLTLSGGTELTNAAGQPAVHVTGASTVNIMGAKFFADLRVDNADTDVTAVNVTFDRSAVRFSGHDLKILSNSLFTDYDGQFPRAPLFFQGHDLQLADTTVDAHDLALPMGQAVVQVAANSNNAQFENVTFQGAPVTFAGNNLVISGATSFRNSLLTFSGASLQIMDAVFSGQGIYHSSSGTAALMNVTITNYTQFGYQLAMGQLSVSNSTFAHDPSISASADGLSPPWALRIDDNFGSDSSVTSLATSYDGVKFMPAKCDSFDQVTCEVVGPSTCGSVYSISPGTKASFSQ
jgi:hypothetical protein